MWLCSDNSKHLHKSHLLSLCIFSIVRVCLLPWGSYRETWHFQGCWATRTSRRRSRLVKVSQTTHAQAHTEGGTHLTCIRWIQEHLLYKKCLYMHTHAERYRQEMLNSLPVPLGRADGFPQWGQVTRQPCGRRPVTSRIPQCLRLAFTQRGHNHTSYTAPTSQST